MKREKVPMSKLVLENCKVTIRISTEMLTDDPYEIRIEDENGLVYDGQGHMIEWNYDQDFLLAVKARLATAKAPRRPHLKAA